MKERWLILFVLFFARTAMAFQYQSTAALSPFIEESFAVTLVDIGVLIGLYLGPGILVAIPGGALAARFGDKRVVAWSLITMIAGGTVMAFGDAWWHLLVGRVLAGAGGVVINVVATKMLVDWFAGHEIGTAMGIFISSWPIGIALALVTLPSLAAANGLFVGWSGMIAVVAVALVLFLAVYRPAPDASAAAVNLSVAALPVVPLLLAAFVWALYNTALAMVFGFGPLMLTTNGLDPTTASSVIGLFTLMVGIGVPLGGYLSDRFGSTRVIAVSLAVSTCSLPVLVALPEMLTFAAYGLAGLVMGLAAGPIMTLPSRVLPPSARAFGMGIFFSIYYAIMMLGPALGGGLADALGDQRASFFFGAGMLGISLFLLVGFQKASSARA